VKTFRGRILLALHLFSLTNARFSYQTKRLLHMRLCDFSLLPENEKGSLLYEHGVYIGKRKRGGKTILLFQLEGFYAEVYYRQYRRVIDSIRCFSDTERLDPYLAQIDVEYLV
jgi:hypothetical protein